MSKAKSTVLLVLKWFFAIYVLGLIVTLNSKLITNISSVTAQGFINSDFAQSELTPFFEFARSPLLSLMLVAIYFVPMSLMSWLLFSIAEHSKFFNQIHSRWYGVISFLTLFVLTLSSFLFG